MPSQRRIHWCAGLAFSLMGLSLLPSCGKQDPSDANKAAAVRVVPVSAATVECKTVPRDLKTFGTVEALATVAVKSQVTGVLRGVHFTDGEMVKENDLLLEIDRAPFEAALKRAQENLGRDQVQKKEAEIEAKRDDELVKRGVSAVQDSDKSRAAADGLAAAVRADMAAVETAKIELDYCTIKSPVTGRAGAILVDKGNVVKANDVPIVVIAQVAPIYVTFFVPEQELPEIRKNHSRAKPLDVWVRIPGEDGVPIPGSLAFINNTVDAATGTIQLRGQFPNKDGRLWPGQYVDVTLTVSRQEGALVIPPHAVQTGQSGEFVFVIKSDATVETRPIVVDRELEGQTIVKAGLKAGDRVVTDGQLRLARDVKVEIKNPPTRAEAPKS